MKLTFLLLAAHTEQDDLIKALYNTDTAAPITKLKKGLRAVGHRILDKVFLDHR